MGVDDKDINAELIHDGVGELINMICGSTKKLLFDTPYHFQLSIPTVILGWGHEIGLLDNSSIASLVFDVGEDSFVIQISLIPKTLK
jgi:chemotaxis protein CheX